MLHKLVYFSLLAICGGYAIVRGGAPERIGAAIWVLDSVFTPLMRSWHAERYADLEFAVMVLDLVILAAFAALALCANRFWPLWVAALHMIGCFGHIAKALDPQINPWAYANMVAAPGYPVCVLLLLAALRHQQRMTKYNADPSWSVF